MSYIFFIKVWERCELGRYLNGYNVCYNMELIKQTRMIGNGAGVLLPRSWANATVKVTLVEHPRLRDIVELVDVERAMGIFLTGSYARGEQDVDSDIDVLVVTSDYDGVESKGKYEISYVSRNGFEGKNFLIYYPMIMEARALMNGDLLEGLKKELKLDGKTVLKYYRDTRKMIKLNEMGIRLCELKGKEFVGGDVCYSLVLRLRTHYIISCLRGGKVWSSRDFVRLVRKVCGSDDAYSSYRLVKKGREGNILKVGEARKLVDYLKDKNEGLKNG